MGNLVFQATLGGQVNLVGPNTASTYNINVPTVNATLATTDANTFTAAQTISSGNLIFSGTGQKVTGDFSNATLTSRAAFQTSTSNGSTGIYALPNGTSTAASWQATNAADPTNASKILIATNGSTDVQLVSGINGTGTYLPLTFYTSGAEKMRLDTSGNLGLGVTPSAWNSGYKAFQISTAAALFGTSTETLLGSNIYVDSGGNNKYITTNYASQYRQVNGQHIFYNAASGTAGNTISLSAGMTLDASGNLGVGTTTPSTTDGTGAKFVSSGNAGGLQAMFTDAANYTIGVKRSGASGTVGMIYGTSGTALALGANNTEAARIDTSGNILFGTTGVPNGTSVYGSAFVPVSFNRTRLAMASSSTASLEIAQFFNPNGQVGSISTSGSATAYTTSSDYRLKENVQPMTGALAKVSALKPSTYTWKADGATGEGFIAHELAEVCPHAVMGEKDEMQIEQYEISPAVSATFDEEGNELTPAIEAVMGEREVPKYQAIDTSFLVATLTAAIQELAAKVAALEAK